jgi:uncharacterized membrane protein
MVFRTWVLGSSLAVRFTLLLSLLFLLPAFVSAQSRQLRITKFNSDVVVTPDSKVDVTETITFRFSGGPWHGIIREIPIEYSGPHGSNYTLFLTVKSVTDESGAKLKVENSRDRQYRKLKIYIPDADNSTRTISIEYTISNALRFFDDHDEFYWNVTGDAWSMPIDSATAHIVFPSNTENIRANVFTGAYRSRAQYALAEIVGTGVDVHTTAPLAMNEGLTVAVAFDKGAVREPTSADKFFEFLRSNWPLIIPVFVFFLMVWLWYTRGRDPRLRPIAAQYEPPDNLTPGEVGTLVDNSVDMRDITATIVDLAVRGYLVIEQVNKDHLMGLTHSKEYIFHLKKPLAEWSKLQPHEQILLGGFFPSGNAEDTITLADLQNRFYQNIPEIKNRIFASLLGHSYYLHRPDTVRAGYLAGAFVAGLLLFFAGSFLSKQSGMQMGPFVAAAILTAIVIAAFGYFMPARTSTGARALEGVLGFEDFLNHVESDRFNRTIKTPEMFEKFLPFAMALGVEKNWSKAFQGIYSQPPSWYQGGYGPNFYPLLFVNDLNSMSTQAGTIMSSAPRSAEGSGFSGGGGDSGGGFGGGGGSGF